MKLLNFVFQLGVVFAIFGFLWGMIQIGYQLLRSGQTKSTPEQYIMKLIKYFFLVDVTFLFCIEKDDINMNLLITTALVLLTYFIGKLQNQQNKVAMFQLVANGIPKNNLKFDLKAEIFVIVFAILFFISFIFFPDYAKNPISIWFGESIKSIENASVFGFIFKIIGFFFLVSMIMKMLNAISFLLSGQPLTSPGKRNFHTNDSNKDDSKFDDFEEIE